MLLVLQAASHIYKLPHRRGITSAPVRAHEGTLPSLLLFVTVRHQNTCEKKISRLGVLSGKNVTKAFDKSICTDLETIFRLVRQRIFYIQIILSNSNTSKNSHIFNLCYITFSCIYKTFKFC